MKKKLISYDVPAIPTCKVVIYNYIFLGFYSVPNLIVILFNLMYPVFHVTFICKCCV